MGPFGSSIASTMLWFSILIPYFLGNTVNDYYFKTFMFLVITPVLVSIYMTNESVTPYFLVPWEIIIPLFIVMYGVVSLLSLISSKYKQGTGLDKRGPSLASIGYVALSVFIILFLGMLAYYYTALFQFSPLGTQV